MRVEDHCVGAWCVHMTPTAGTAMGVAGPQWSVAVPEADRCTAYDKPSTSHAQTIQRRLTFICLRVNTVFKLVIFL